MSISHVVLPVPPGKRNVDTELSFCLASLAHLGVKEIMRPLPTSVGFGKDVPNFWISDVDEKETPYEVCESGKVTRMHVGVCASKRSQVDEFYKAGLKAGGIDYEKPQLKEMNHPNYYAASLVSPAGHVIEVVCHEPEA